MQRNQFDSAVSAILDNLSKLNDDFAQDTVFPELPDDGDIKSHVHRFTYVVKPRKPFIKL